MPKRKQENENQELKSLDELRSQLRKDYGSDAIKTYITAPPTPTISTGVMGLDNALGGGLPLKRITELYGNNSSGKSTLTLATMVEAQKLFPNQICVYIDVEHALDVQWAVKIGIDLKRFDHLNPQLAEDAIYMMEAYLKLGKASVIAIDSIAALITKVEMEEKIEKANIGSQARLITQAVKRIINLLQKSPESLIIIINQKRAQIAGSSHGFDYEPTKTAGGMALPFFATTRLNLSLMETLKEKEKVCGQKVRVQVAKNKVNKGPGAIVSFWIHNKKGIDKAQELLEWAKSKELIELNGSWYTIKGTDIKLQGEVPIKEIIEKTYIEKWSKLARDEI